MFKVKARDPRGQLMNFACGTADQVLERIWELTRRGFRDILVADPGGKEMTGSAFERFLDLD